MLSYQHEYHAGNHADVLKHWLLLECLRYLQRKATPFDYIDTHAGSGLYKLDSVEACKTGEAQQGIIRLQDAELAGLQDYLDQVKPYLGRQQYPGSPLLAIELLRSTDRAWLFERHPRSSTSLRQLCGRKRGYRISTDDGFSGLLGLLPSPSRRCLVLMDPSYEIKSDYQRVFDTSVAAWRRMPGVVLLLWYPVVNRDAIDKLEAQFAASPIGNAQLFEMGIADDQARGMSASGLIVINPPWTLAEAFHNTIPAVSALLSGDGRARTRFVQFGSP